jgi:hypothetical protein
VPAAELVPARKSKVTFGSLKDKVGEMPDAFLDPMSEEELADWGA